MASIIVRRGHQQVCVVRLVSLPVTLGSAPDSTLVLEGVAPRHGRIEGDRDGYRYEPLEAPGSGRALKHGDEVTLGRYVLCFRADEPVDVAEATLVDKARSSHLEDTHRRAGTDETATHPGRPRASEAHKDRVTSGAPAGPLLVVVGTAQRLQLPDDGGVIGRLSSCAVRLKDKSVGRRHAEIRHRGNWVLIDLGSVNGTYVNGERITKHPLQQGDRVQLGRMTLEYHEPTGATRSAAGTRRQERRAAAKPTRPRGRTLALYASVVLVLLFAILIVLVARGSPSPSPLSEFDAALEDARRVRTDRDLWARVTGIGQPLPQRPDLTNEQRGKVGAGIAEARQAIDGLDRREDEKVVRDAAPLLEKEQPLTEKVRSKLRDVAARWGTAEGPGAEARRLLDRDAERRRQEDVLAKAAQAYEAAIRWLDRGDFDQAERELERTFPLDGFEKGRQRRNDIEELRNRVCCERGTRWARSESVAQIDRGIAELRRVSSASQWREPAGVEIRTAEDRKVLVEFVRKPMDEAARKLATGDLEGAIDLLNSVVRKGETVSLDGLPETARRCAEARDLLARSGSLKGLMDDARPLSTDAGGNDGAIQPARAAWQRVRNAALQVDWGGAYRGDAEKKLKALDDLVNRRVTTLLTTARDLAGRVAGPPRPEPEERARLTREIIRQCGRALALNAENQEAVDLRDRVRKDLDRQLRDLYYYGYVFYKNDRVQALRFLDEARRLTGADRLEPSAAEPADGDDFLGAWRGWIDQARAQYE